MLKNYLKIAWRNLWKNKLFTSINIVSLAIGLSTSFVIGILVYYDLSFDTFHKDSDRIYRITSNFTSPEFKAHNRGVPRPLTTSVKEDFKGVEQATYFYTGYIATVNTPQKEHVYREVNDVIYTDESYFKLFRYDWLAGSPHGILENPDEVVLTKNRAQKYFPGLSADQILGKTLIYNDSMSTRVTGIVDDLKQRSDFKGKEFISLKTAVKSSQRRQILSENWLGTNSGVQLFVKLDKNINKQVVKEQLDELAAAKLDEELSVYKQKQRFHLQPLSDLHFNADYGIFNFSGSPASRSSLWGLSGIALFILLLACINFINLNTAQATKRAKEIGIIKALGAAKRQVMFQMLGEMFLLTVIATLVSVVFAVYLLRIFGDFTPEGVTAELFTSPQIIGFIIVLLICVTLLSGFYPAMVLSKFRPSAILRNKVSSGRQSASLRRYLTIFQFVIAQVFILATLLVGKQISFMMNKDMGFKTNAIAYVQSPWYDSSEAKRLQFMEELKAIPLIQDISLGNNPPASFNVSSSNLIYREGEKEIQKEVEFLYGDLNYLNLYNIDLLAGRERLNDTIKEYVINESYLKVLGFQDPVNAIGKILEVDGEKTPIVGVMKDFNQRSLKSPIQPLVLTGDIYGPRFRQLNTIHFSMAEGSKENWAATLAKVERVYKKIYPDAIFDISFMDQTVAQFYEQEQKMSTLLRWAMGLSILISCLGLFGLVIHTIQARVKEIGIRKVLGQRSAQITLLLSREFMQLVVISVAIGIPVAYLFFKDWLSGFTYRVPVDVSYFVIAGAITLMVAFLTVSSQTVLASRLDPAKTLKEE
ncbi:FtsX-like permease family protein [Leptobacterium flavescens]|uniref:FtsX-like permease family protein n=1 Tax=Leptobacterium flavescens TaxID=472055 RepID=A0A6P0UIA4_9FLAO|nr:FtsX-like permease family protein [Leptobacterium flavescens]NER13025.1 FtsX-like permease family protein [Leptobacterium flavescens]